jgi:hypothetical protein
MLSNTYDGWCRYEVIDEEPDDDAESGQQR